VALRADGTVVAWGGNDHDWTPPAGLGDVVAIAAGNNHALALQADGTLVSWGYNNARPSDPPGVSVSAGAVAVSACGYHGLALRGDGTVVGWGRNDYGQTNVPSDLKHVVAVAAGGLHSLALKADGKVVGWGAGGPGREGTGHSGQTTIPNDLSNVVAIAAGGGHSLALKADGTVRAWGDSFYDQTRVPHGLSNVVAIAAGWSHSFALKADGTVVGWGYNWDGEANGAAAGTNVVAVAGGAHHGLALRADGTLRAWGNSWQGNTTIPAGLTNVVAIEAGGHNMALKADGTVVAWGWNAYGQTNVPAGLNSVVAMAAAETWSLALKADGTVVAWGRNDYGQTNVPAVLAESQGSVACTRSTALNPLAVLDLTTNHLNGALVNHTTWAPGAPGRSWPPGYALSFDGVDDSVLVTNFGPQLPIDEVTVELWQRAHAAKQQSTFGLEPDDERNRFQAHLPWSWDGTGQEVYWDFGDDIGGGRLWYVPPVSLLGTWQHFALVAKSGSNGFMRIYRNGVLEAEQQGGPPLPSFANKNLRLGGMNSTGNFAGELDEFRIWRSARTQQEIVANMTNRLSGTESNLVAYWTFDSGPGVTESTRGATQVAAGRDFSLALRSNGTVVAWGVNQLNQCGVPAGLAGVVDIAAGQAHGLALRNNGSVVAWGWNLNGQTNIPFRATNGVVAVAAGQAHSLALKNDGSVVAWGCDTARQCSAPDDLANVVAIAAGGRHSLALKANGSVVAWGGNNAAQTNVPPWLDQVVAVAAGEEHSLALRAPRGEVVAWGCNTRGQTNVPWAAQSGVVAIATHQGHSLALKSNGTVVAWGGNLDGQTNLPSELSNVLAVAAGERHNVFLAAESASHGAVGQEFVLADIPFRVSNHLLPTVERDLVQEIVVRAGDLHTNAVTFSGAKALLGAVLELGMSYTMKQDDVLRGFFYGSEPLLDLDAASSLLSDDAERLVNSPNVRPILLGEVAASRSTNFAARLNAQFQNLQTNGQPEIPRIAGHTLRLLNLLRDAWAQVVVDGVFHPEGIPPAALELGRATNGLSLFFYGEPYLRYSLKESVDLRHWSDTPFTTLRSERMLTLTNTGPWRFFGLTPTPPVISP
jgi:alpha-tubulin suppressor-like RCC1 family protein